MLVRAQAVAGGNMPTNAGEKTVFGVGHAEKHQVTHMVEWQLAQVDPAGPMGGRAGHRDLPRLQSQTAGRLAQAIGAAS